MNVDLHNYLVEKCQNKKDGVYQYKGVLYVAKNGKFIGYSSSSFEIFRVINFFRNSIVAFRPYEIRNKLKEIFLK